MKAQLVDAFIVMPPDGFDSDFEPDAYQAAATPEQAWGLFCNPSLLRSAYEEEGFSPVSIVVEVHPLPATHPARPLK